MGLAIYVLRRVILLSVILLGVTFLTFSIAAFIPGDPAAIWAGRPDIATESQLEQVRSAYHLNDPWYIQYGWYLNGILHGDLRTSPITGRPITTDLATYLPNTIELGLFALTLSMVFGGILGIVAATRRDTLEDHLSRLGALSSVSLPTFWTALLFQLIFYYILRWFPDPGGIINQEVLFSYPLHRITGFNTLDALLTGNWPSFTSLLNHMVMPGLVMSFLPTALIARITRASMLEVMTQDYVRTARAYGVPEHIVIYKLALKNALIPTATTVALAIGDLLTGSVIVETIFYWPGIGRYSVNAVQSFDFPALNGVVLVVATIFALANLLADISYAFLDPRVRQG